MIPELRDLSYEERLKECGLTTLETRRLRGDQIEVFKILNGYEIIDRNMFFSLKKDSRTRGHEVKLVKDQCRLDIRKHSFSQRTINEWNKLSTDCVTATSVNMSTLGGDGRGRGRGTMYLTYTHQGYSSPPRFRRLGFI